MKLHESGLLRGDQAHCTSNRTPGSLLSNFLSKLLSLCKNTMTSANRRVNSSWPAEAKNGRLPRHSIFIFTSSTFSCNSIGPCFLSNPPESLSPHLIKLFPSTAPDVRDGQSNRIKAFPVEHKYIYVHRYLNTIYSHSCKIKACGLISPMASPVAGDIYPSRTRAWVSYIAPLGKCVECLPHPTFTNKSHQYVGSPPVGYIHSETMSFSFTLPFCRLRCLVCQGCSLIMNPINKYTEIFLPSVCRPPCLGSRVGSRIKLNELYAKRVFQISGAVNYMKNIILEHKNDSLQYIGMALRGSIHSETATCDFYVWILFFQFSIKVLAAKTTCGLCDEILLSLTYDVLLYVNLTFTECFKSDFRFNFSGKTAKRDKGESGSIRKARIGGVEARVHSVMTYNHPQYIKLVHSPPRAVNLAINLTKTADGNVLSLTFWEMSTVMMLKVESRHERYCLALGRIGDSDSSNSSMPLDAMYKTLYSNTNNCQRSISNPPESLSLQLLENFPPLIAPARDNHHSLVLHYNIACSIFREVGRMLIIKRNQIFSVEPEARMFVNPRGITLCELGTLSTVIVSNPFFLHSGSVAYALFADKQFSYDLKSTNICLKKGKLSVRDYVLVAPPLQLVRSFVKNRKLSAVYLLREAPPPLQSITECNYVLHAAISAIGLTLGSHFFFGFYTNPIDNDKVVDNAITRTLHYLRSRLPAKFCAIPLLLTIAGIELHGNYLFHRYNLTMPANRNRRGYNPLNEAEIPLPRDAWERRVNKTSLKPKKKSDNFRIPKTACQAPVTVMPGGAYPTNHTTYAGSRKSNPDRARRAGSVYYRPSLTFPRDITLLISFLVPTNMPDLSSKKAHLQWLHYTAIPNMDRDIMKTNSLVDNILTEQAELDTQMAAIQAMGGQAAFQDACKAHAGLRKAIANRLADTKKKRAKQFETIRSMRTVMQTLVAEIGEADSIRHDIRHSVYATRGNDNENYYYNYVVRGNLLQGITYKLLLFIGPNPRSLLRPEVNRDRHHIVSLSGTTLITPPNTPNRIRLEQKIYTCVKELGNCSLYVCTKFLIKCRENTASESLHAEDTNFASSSPVFSSDEEINDNTIVPPNDLLSPISSPDRDNGQCIEPAIGQTPRYDNTYCNIMLVKERLRADERRPSISFSCSCSNNRAARYKLPASLLNHDSSDPTLRDSTPFPSRTYPSYNHLDIRTDLDRYYSSTLGTVALDYPPWFTMGCTLDAGPRGELGTPCSSIRCNISERLLNVPTSILSPHLDILQAATEAAGIDGDSSFSVEYDSPSPPPPRVSTPNRDLINSRDPRRMPKSKNNHRGSGDTTPPKTPRTTGSYSYDCLELGRKPAQGLGYYSIDYLFHTAAPPEDDLLNMSGIQDGEDTANSSDLNSTLQGDASMASEGTGNGEEGNGGSTPEPEHFEQRQSTPNQETPRSNEQDQESEDDSSSDDDDDEEEDKDDDGATQSERDLQSDLGKVREAVSMAGGLSSRKPDFEKQKEREGQHVEIVEQWMDFTNDTFDDLPERPDESTLRRISLKELLPPATSVPVPLDMELDGEELTFVANQRIEFLVIMRKEGDAKASWGFPCEAQLLKLYNHVRNAADHDQIMDVCLWCRVDGATGIASIMLSTINLSLFKRIRHEIRIFNGFTGFRCETYSKITFMQKYGVTLYIPKDVAGMNDKRLFKTLFRKYRYLNVRFLILTRTTFTKDHPDKPPHKRSRIGDTILLLDGPDLYEVLKKEPEDKKYFLNDGFSVTLRGGIRSTGPTALFASSFASQVISGLPAETMRQTENRA